MGTVPIWDIRLTQGQKRDGPRIPGAVAHAGDLVGGGADPPRRSPYGSRFRLCSSSFTSAMPYASRQAAVGQPFS